MEKKKRVKKEKVDEQKVSEIFEIEKQGKTEVVEAHGVEAEKAPSEEQMKKEGRVFRTVIIVMVAFALMFFVVYMLVNSMKYFEVDGVKFQIIKEGTLTFYKTSIPVLYGGKPADYNFYLREDPRELGKKVPINGTIAFRKNVVLDVTTKNLFCAGDWNYFQLQLMKLNVFNITLLVKNNSAEYQPENNYMFMTINEGNKTEIKQTGDNLYDVNVDNCEIATIADEIMLKAFATYKKLNK